MKDKNIVPSKIIELETSIKLLEHLKRNNVIDDVMYNFCINKLIGKLELEKSKINDEVLKVYDEWLYYNDELKAKQATIARDLKLKAIYR